MGTTGRTIKLLLTGFQGWGDVQINPSESIGQQLDGAILSLPTIPGTSEPPTSSTSETDAIASSGTASSSNSAIVTFKPVRVSYREIEKLVPQFHDSGEWDCIVHVGLAKGYEACTIETGSSKSEQYLRLKVSGVGTYVDYSCDPESLGYHLKDVDGELAPEVGFSRGVEGAQARWECTMDCQECCDELNDMGYKNVKLSPDPGNFCCGYITTCSLRYAYERAEKDRRRKPIPVVFFHVPEPKEDDPTAPYTLSELTDIVRALCNFTARQAIAG
ncbi:hypothetical protein QFC22_001984 [Naganishia vaughanmartiniae]|uniref:Uncharacterized protein n=1 Tax=Naganishia vaughanmartiniae TaxID=1424756 RepID=A0ACC2XG25_9TREE|nr:hypothetical protein QFC22_001984 [Naganishia vaughanmartiniae]